MKVVTKKNNRKLFVSVSRQLTEGNELMLGGLAEGSDCPGNSWGFACVYWLRWSKDRAAYGLTIDRYGPIPEHLDDAEQHSSDRYTWAIDNLPCKTEAGPILIVEVGESAGKDEAYQVLEAAYLDGGGMCITDPKCP